MAGVILRTAAGTALFVAFLWLVRIDDYRVAGMMLTFPMLNGIGLLGAGENAERQIKSMLPVITLNGAMCFLFAWILAASEFARSHPALVTTLAVAAWLGVYAVLETGNIAFARNTTMTAFAAGCALASLVITYWLWPACAFVPTATVVRWQPSVRAPEKRPAASAPSRSSSRVPSAWRHSSARPSDSRA